MGYRSLWKVSAMVRAGSHDLPAAAEALDKLAVLSGYIHYSEQVETAGPWYAEWVMKCSKWYAYRSDLESVSSQYPHVQFEILRHAQDDRRTWLIKAKAGEVTEMEAGWVQTYPADEL